MDLGRILSLAKQAVTLVPTIVSAVRIADRFLDKKGKAKEDVAIEIVMDDLVPMLVGNEIGPDVLKAPTVQTSMRTLMVAIVGFTNAIRDELRRLAALEPTP
jgi:hypothetical protein